MLGIAICFNIFIGFKWKFMCTKICGSNLRSMSSGKVIHTQMLALVALAAFFFLFPLFFFYPSPSLSLSPRSSFLTRLGYSTGHSCTRRGTLGLQPLDFIFCHWLNRCSHDSQSQSHSNSNSVSSSNSKLKQMHFQYFKQLKQSLSIFQHRLSMSSLLQN